MLASRTNHPHTERIVYTMKTRKHCAQFSCERTEAQSIKLYKDVRFVHKSLT
ncbi:Uncharacterized protein APZ42_032717 [Daphnia magna]|uniref:Uncharacterized protein n=1 Tax=Daphnia magna TaxID=35525 RepID=A0A164LTK5_9CRUS|nr:Uncharacterized protein APZ42_032717 [Daphnia magna]